MLVRLFIVFLTICIVTGCGGNAPKELPDPVTILQKAADDLKQVSALRFKLQLTGAPAFVDFSNTIAFVSADGTFLQPDRVAAKVKARLLGIPGEVDVVAIGDKQYMKNAVLTANRWLEQQFSPGFNAQEFMRGDSGVQSAIKAFLDVKMIGIETTTEGVEVYHITGKAKAADVDALTVGLIRGADVEASIYINTETGKVEKINMVQPDTKTADQDATTWLLEIYDYNATDIQIEQPAVVNVAATPAFQPLVTAVP
ncbi:MAG: LppX_LprAFG lipoprotein [Anaerolineae bacterium]|nr:LppX_LprAFG lipoprotein [Anaerolineae bacterium]